MSFDMCDYGSSLIIEDLKRSCREGKMDEKLVNIIQILVHQQKKIDKQEKKITNLENVIKRQNKKIRKMKGDRDEAQCYNS